MKVLLPTLLLATTATAFCGDFISIGVKGGVPLTDAFTTATTGNASYFAQTKRYTIGPELDVNLPLGFAVEVDALYKRLGYTTSGNLPDVFFRGNTTANQWEFPLLLKYRFGPGPVKPYLLAGPNFRNVSNIKQIGSFLSGTPVTSTGSDLNNSFSAGLALGGGIQFKLPIITIAPEIRYTRWGWESFKSTNGLLQSNNNQAEFLIGVTF